MLVYSVLLLLDINVGILEEIKAKKPIFLKVECGKLITYLFYFDWFHRNHLLRYIAINCYVGNNYK